MIYPYVPAPDHDGPYRAVGQCQFPVLPDQVEALFGPPQEPTDEPWVGEWHLEHVATGHRLKVLISPRPHRPVTVVGQYLVTGDAFLLWANTAAR